MPALCVSGPWGEKGWMHHVRGLAVGEQGTSLLVTYLVVIGPERKQFPGKKLLNRTLWENDLRGGNLDICSNIYREGNR